MGTPVDKGYRGGCDRAVPPAATLARARPLMSELGITRIANITGLDRVGVPTVAVYRPNARSVSVSQGKGATLVEAQVSGLMEAIELHHAERVKGPLCLASHRELDDGRSLVDVSGLPQLTTSRFDRDLPLLWMAGVDLLTGASTLVPFELVHADFRVPFPTGSGAFLMSSNGLASGNHLTEATSHAICELIERDANTLWHASGPEEREARRVDPSTIDDPASRDILDRFERAGLVVGIWETTSDVGVASFLVTIVDRDENVARPMPPVTGSGCHPLRRVALLRSLTESAQGRLTMISGARDDLSSRAFDEANARARSATLRARLRGRPTRSFLEAADANHGDFDADLRFELQQLVAAGLRQIITINLTDPRLQIPVVRVVIPHLEAMSEVPDYAPGARARRRLAERS